SGTDDGGKPSSSDATLAWRPIGSSDTAHQRGVVGGFCTARDFGSVAEVSENERRSFQRGIKHKTDLARQACRVHSFLALKLHTVLETTRKELFEVLVSTRN